MGITDISTILMVLAVSTKMSSKEQEVVTSLMIQGFNDTAKEANTNITGGQTIYNPGPIIGGTAIANCRQSEFIMPNGAQPGDVILLTKPLGTQIAVNAYQWMLCMPEKWQKVEKYITREQMWESYMIAVRSMATLNKFGAELMQKYGAHGATDVTGFGILGHLNYLANAQKQNVSIRVDTLPVIRGLYNLEGKARDFKIKQGYCAETSGGLAICIERSKAEQIQKELLENGQESWIIGEVIEGGDRQAFLSENLQIRDV